MTEPSTPIQLEYESADPLPRGPRPWWVWAIIGAYFLILLATLGLVSWDMFNENGLDVHIIAAVTIAVLSLSGIGLIVTPVQLGRRGRMTRGSIWFPIIASGLLLGLLVTGAGWALLECIGGERVDEIFFLGVAIGGASLWLFWAIFIWLMTSSRNPNSIATWLHRSVLAGSVAELLVAVPCHIVVRRRSECCAGVITGSAICIGTIVMFIAFGPSVVFLYYRRWQKITGNN